MKVSLGYTSKAKKDLTGLDRITREKIILKLEFFCYKSFPMKHAKPLSRCFKGLYRFRVGDYRAIFAKGADGNLIIITIIRIKHRKDVSE